MGFGAYFRLAHAGLVLAREGALALIDNEALPPVLRFGFKFGRLLERRSVRQHGPQDRLRTALNRLGPTYVKFGQTLATRPDIVGTGIAANLAQLQDAMAPFDVALVPGLLANALKDKAEDLRELSPPIAAASIAQVHKAVLIDNAGARRAVAVKVLRPQIKARFRADLDSYYAGARLIESLSRPIRRLRPLDMVKTLDRSARLELDLRLEAAAISEMAANIKDDEGFIVPSVDWDHTAETVLTTGWVEGIPIRDNTALDAAGFDRKGLARILLQSFLRHAIRDGFFHADLHPGNLFAGPDGTSIIAVDFGIMGRITRAERRFLADVLYGFITRNYRHMAQRHFDIGYVPKTQSVDDFALALRAIGEPLHGRMANDISMASVLGQLFATTELFDMAARPELILLQKSMVLVEGVARALDPELDIWSVAEPVVGDWVKREAGPLGRLEDIKEGLAVATETIGRLPGLIDRADAALSDYEEQRHGRDARRNRGWLRLGLWLAALTCLVVLIRVLSSF